MNLLELHLERELTYKASDELINLTEKITDDIYFGIQEIPTIQHAIQDIVRPLKRRRNSS